MPTYKPVLPDDVIDIREGMKFAVITKDGLLPDGRLRPQGADETDNEWKAYVTSQLDKVMDQYQKTDAQITAELRKLFAMPDAFKGDGPGKIEARIKYMDDTEAMIAREVASTSDLRKKRREDDAILWYYQQVMAIPLVLQANEVSRIHKMLEGRILREGKFGTLDFDFEQTFVVRHDWLAVIGDTNPELGEWELPYTQCVFEFKVGGHYCITLASETETGKKFIHIIYVKDDRWWNPQQEIPLTKFLEQQIAACCVVLEAEVATHTVVRQPPALQAKRKKTGKHPMVDYHVVDLSRKKSRVANPLDTQTPEELKGRKRLHFCRAHWRNLPTHRVRIPWCLKGDPELGFVDKMYRL